MAFLITIFMAYLTSSWKTNVSMVSAWMLWGPHALPAPNTERFRKASSLRAYLHVVAELNTKPWILPPLSNSWIIMTIWLCVALNRIPNMDCYWGGAVPKLNPKLSTPKLLFYHSTQKHQSLPQYPKPFSRFIVQTHVKL